MPALTGVIILLSVPAFSQGDHYVSVKRNFKLMGSSFEITIVAQNEDIGYINVEEAASEIKRIEQLISSWDPRSETSLINRNAGVKPVQVSMELYHLVERSIQLSELTGGAFDITYATLDTLWRFDGSMVNPPLSRDIKNVLNRTGYRNIKLDPADHSVYLPHKGMRINFGGIGKGYAADKAKALLVSRQVPAGMINANGDITTWGTRPTGEKWLIGVANPLGNGNLIRWIPLQESSVAISGNRRQYVSMNGTKYTDVLDPRTGYPVSGIFKVTVFAKTAEFCDAISTAIFVLGNKKGLSMVNQLGGTEVIIEDDSGKLFYSKGLLLDVH